MELKYNLFHACLSITIVIMLAVKHAHSGIAEILVKVRQLDEYEIEIYNKSTLGYDSPCSPEGVEFNEASVNTFEEFTKIGNTDLSLIENTLDKFIAASEKFLTTGHHLCNSSKILACDKSTKRCSCGPPKILGVEYSYVRDRNENCLWARDSPCFPIGKLPGIQKTCAGNTNCIFTNVTGEKIDCDYPNYIKATTTTDGTIEIPKCYCNRFHTTDISYPDTDSYNYPEYPSPQYTAYANSKSGYCKLNFNLFILFCSTFIICS